MNLKIKNSLICIILSILVGLGLLLAAYTIPTDKIENNVLDSINTLKQEGVYKDVFSWCQSKLDNFTDSLMLLNAANKNDKSLIDNVLSIYRIGKSDESAYTILTNYQKYINDGDISSYGRYWHGYLVILKPLLYFFNYSQIRIINLITQTLLTITLIYMMYKKDIKEYIIPYLICLFMLNPCVSGMSLQYSSCFYVYNFSNLLLLLNKDKLYKYDYLIFLFTGILLAYFDLLTYPLVTLCIPLLFYMSINKKVTLKKIIELCLWWLIGYSFMWASKWILSDVLLHTNVIYDAISEILYRTNITENEYGFNVIDCVTANYGAFLKTPVTIILFIYIFVSMIQICRKHGIRALFNADIYIYIY